MSQPVSAADGHTYERSRTSVPSGSSEADRGDAAAAALQGVATPRPPRSEAWRRRGRRADHPRRGRETRIVSRCCIEQWLAAGRTTSPMTGETLEDFKLRPNHFAKQTIAAFLEEARELGRAVDADSE